MKKLLYSIITAVALLLPGAASAQCTIKNEAFKGGESISYNLYFNWQFIWIKAGTASMSIKDTSYKGKPAYCTSLITKSSQRVDKMFMMRDTLLVYSTKDLAPLYYRKGAHEGKRYYVDEMWYTYPNGKCAVSLRHLHNNGTVTKENHTYNDCVYDMLNIFLRARNYSTAGWKKGYTIPVDIAGGTELTKARLYYRGRTTVKADNKKKYECEILSYEEKEDNKYKEIVRFFVTADKRHIPIRLDLNLRFGSAKAFLSNIKE